MPRISPLAVALATAATLCTTMLAAAPGSASTSGSSERAAKPSPAGFALRSAGFGTRLTGGQVPARSQPTAYTAIGCTTQAGASKENHEAEAALPGVGTISGVKTRLWTRKRGGVVHSYSRNTTANVVLAQSGLGTLQIRAITSLSHAWHDAKGFHAATSTNIGSLEFVPAVGDPQQLALPTPDRPVDIPGLAKISVGDSVKRTTAHGGFARANTLEVVVRPTNTRLTIAHSSAEVLDGVRNGTFHGYSAATKVSAVDDAVTSGRTPLALMPCEGTNGRVQSKSIAEVNLGDQIVVSGLRAQQRGKQLARKSTMFERGSVAKLNLGNGALVITGVVGQANVTRTASGKVTTSAKGTTVGRITANGQRQKFPHTGVLNIPHVAKLQQRVVQRKATGISVTALRITLLDGTGATINLGAAKAFMRQH